MTTNALLVQFHDEIMRHRGDVLNFTSFLRVTCLRYLRRKCDQLGAAREADATGEAEAPLPAANAAPHPLNAPPTSAPTPSYRPARRSWPS
jgi:predicted DNA-binding ribbon-helix-helix protein